MLKQWSSFLWNRTLVAFVDYKCNKSSVPEKNYFIASGDNRMRTLHQTMCYLMVLYNSNHFKHLRIGICSYHLLQLVSTSPIYLMLKPQLNWHSTCLFSASCAITVILAIYSMSQSKINRKLANLEVSLTKIDMNEGYATQSNLKSNSPLYWTEENNLVPF